MSRFRYVCGRAIGAFFRQDGRVPISYDNRRLIPFPAVNNTANTEREARLFFLNPETTRGILLVIMPFPTKPSSDAACRLDEPGYAIHLRDWEILAFKQGKRTAAKTSFKLRDAEKRMFVVA